MYSPTLRYSFAIVEAHAPLAIERDMPANPKAGKALLRRLPMEERFGMAQFSHLLGHTELNWCDEILQVCTGSRVRGRRGKCPIHRSLSPRDRWAEEVTGTQ